MMMWMREIPVISFHPLPLDQHVLLGYNLNSLCSGVGCKLLLIFLKLFFTEELVNNIVRHTNSYAVEHITEGTHRSYAQADGS